MSMNEHDFCMWLQGFVEMNPNAMPTLTQWRIIKDRLALVVKKETPVQFPPFQITPNTFPRGISIDGEAYKLKPNPFIANC